MNKVVQYFRKSPRLIVLASVFIVAGIVLVGSALASTFTDDTQAEFDAGSYSNTSWSTDHVELSSGQSSGTFTSQVFDGGSSGTVNWNQLSWTESLPSATKLLVVDTTADVYRSINSGSSWSLVKDDYNAGTANAGVDDLLADSNKVLYIVHNQAVWQSTDYGVTWTQATGSYGGANAIRATRDSANSLYLVDGGEDIWRSTNAGVSWTQSADNMNGGTGNAAGLAAVGTTLYLADVAADVW